ncbi:hypothetical protein Hanom_Chr11g01059001 [Helianthus anomalus]
MNEDNMNKIIEFFLSKEHMDRSLANKSKRQKQKYTLRGEMSTYSFFQKCNALYIYIYIYMVHISVYLI